MELLHGARYSTCQTEWQIFVTVFIKLKYRLNLTIVIEVE